MKREWKPGDVAAVTLFDGVEVRAIRVARCPMCKHYGALPHWHVGSEHGGNLPMAKDVDARPLVVIDPEDVVQVRALNIALGGTLTDRRVGDALREFANPTPPKPDEPTDPASRVTDRRENTWRLLADGDWVCVYGPDSGEYLSWDQLADDRGPLAAEVPR